MTGEQATVGERLESSPLLDTLSAEFDELLESMQTPEAQEALLQAFRATPEELAQATVADPETVVHEGSGNLWADLGYPDAEETFLRSRLLWKVVDLIRELGLTPAGAAKRLRVTRQTASDILNGKLQRFSFDDLIAFLRALDHEVEFVVKPIVRDEAASSV